MILELTGIRTAESNDDSATIEYVVLGGKHVGESIARRLRGDGHPVSLIDETHESDVVPTRSGDPGDVRVLEDAGVSADSVVIVATPRDGRNLLLAQIVRTHFDVTDVLVLVNDPERHDLVADTGHEPVCVATALSEAVASTLEPTVAELDHTT